MEVPSIIYNFTAWGSWVVSVFFFITGYGLMVSYRRKGRDYLRGFIPHRLGKLLPPFLLAMTAWLLLMKLLRGHDFFTPFLGLAHGDTPLPHSWFVYAILLFYLFFYLVARLMPKPLHIIAALWVLSTLYIIALRALHFGGWWYISVYALNVGFTYAHYESRARAWLERKPWHPVAAAFVMLGLLVLPKVVVMAAMPFAPAGFAFRTTVKLIGIVLPLFLVLCVYVMGMWQGRILRFLGTISYEIYLVQGCCIIALPDWSRPWPVSFVTVYAAAILSAWILHKTCAYVSALFHR